MPMSGDLPDASDGNHHMIQHPIPLAIVIALAAPSVALAQAAAPNDAQIAHIAYTAGMIDIAAA
jgi:putative membrane protein